MKKMIVLAVALFHLSVQLSAQKPALVGSGTVVTRNLSFTDFDKLQLQNLDGEITVEVGKPFAISIAIDDNLEKLLAVSVTNGKLTIALKGNENNRLYVENTNIRIRISMPEISVLQHNSNSNLVVNGIVGRYCRIENGSNGDVLVSGTIDELDLVKKGNGDLDARGVLAKKVAVTAYGNGDVRFTTANEFTATGSGNGNVVNYGVGKPSGESRLEGNGRITKPGGEGWSLPGIYP
jgi:Putative auto-transporter adhesin, head GIN domain